MGFENLLQHSDPTFSSDDIGISGILAMSTTVSPNRDPFNMVLSLRGRASSRGITVRNHQTGGFWGYNPQPKPGKS